MTLSECVERWINRREISLAPSTILGYRTLFRKYIQPVEVCTREVGDLDEDDMIELLRPLIQAGHSRQAQLLQVLVGAVLKDLVRRRAIGWNPMDCVDRVKHHAKFRAWLTEEQARALLRSSREAGDVYYIAWVLMLCCGLRRGEMLGLRWEDVDFDRQELRIERQRLRVERRIIETTPKSAASVRVIPLEEPIITELRLQRRRGKYIIDSTPEQMSAALDAAVRRAGVPRVTPHGLRHTMAATAASEGVTIKTLQTILGHAHYSVTADVYAHCNDQARRSAAHVVAWATLPARLEIV